MKKSKRKCPLCSEALDYREKNDTPSWLFSKDSMLYVCHPCSFSWHLGGGDDNVRVTHSYNAGVDGIAVMRWMAQRHTKDRRAVTVDRHPGEEVQEIV